MAFTALSLSGSSRRLLAFAHDMVATSAAISFAYYIRYQAGVWSGAGQSLLITSAFLLPAAALVYHQAGLYRGIWRFASIPDLAAILKAVTVLSIALIVFGFLARDTVVVPRSVVAVYWLAQCALLGGPRLIYRIYRDQRVARALAKRSDKAAAVLILGATGDAEVMIRAIETSSRDTIFCVGVLSHRAAHVGQVIREVPVLGTLDQLEDVVRDLEAKGVRIRGAIVCGDTLESSPRIEAIVGRARRMGLNVERPQYLREQGRRAGYLSRFQPVQIEDVVGRSARKIDLEPMRRLISGRRVLVTGGGGSIGTEICRQIARLGCERLMILENSEFALYQVTQRLRGSHANIGLDPVLCDVRMRDDVFYRFADFKPDIVFHAAAYKHVPMLEHQPRTAVHTNVLGTRNVADAAVHAGAAAFVLISTDKAVNPVSVMGATKRAAEVYCDIMGERVASAAVETREGEPARTRFVSVRFGNVLGTSGSVVPLFNAQIAEGGPVTVTHPDMERFFMSVSEAVSLVLMASAFGIRHSRKPSTFVLDMGEPIRIADLAERMIRLAGLEPGKDIRIDIVGLREGERIREALVSEQEDISETEVDGIYVANRRDIDANEMLDRFLALERDLASMTPDEIRAWLADMAPGYMDAGSADPSRGGDGQGEKVGGGAIDLRAV